VTKCGGIAVGRRKCGPTLLYYRRRGPAPPCRRGRPL